MTTNDANQESVERCVFATPTEYGWCNCNRICKIVVCANAERNANLASRFDGAAFHSFPADGYNALFRRDKEPLESNPRRGHSANDAHLWTCVQVHLLTDPPKQT